MEKGWLFWTCLAVIIVNSIIGLTSVAVIIHEASHWADFDKYADHTSDSICLLAKTSNITSYSQALFDFSDLHGYYSAKYEDEEVHLGIRKYTELKAYSIVSIVSGIFLFCFFVVIKKIWGWSSSGL